MDIEQKELIEQLFIEMYEKLVTYARCSLPEASLAEEAVQETFRIACQKPESLQNSPNPQGWLVNTLKHTIRNIKHNRATAGRILAQYLQVSRDDMPPEDSFSIKEAYRSVINLEEYKLLKEFAIDGRSHLEMATARGISINTCKKRLQRVKENLRNKFL